MHSTHTKPNVICSDDILKFWISTHIIYRKPDFNAKATTHKHQNPKKKTKREKCIYEDLPYSKEWSLSCWASRRGNRGIRLACLPCPHYAYPSLMSSLKGYHETRRTILIVLIRVLADSLCIPNICRGNFESKSKETL